MVEKIQLEAGLELWKVKIGELKEQDLNARSMSKPMLERLTETIQRDRRLEALPFCALTSEGLEIVSGHHRIRAAHMAGLKETFVLVDTQGLTKSQIKAKQLAHNAISGQDDPSLLAQIFAQIESVEDMRESFINEDALKGLKGIRVDEVILDTETKTVYLSFVPDYFERWEELIKAQGPLVDQLAVADSKFYQAFHKALKAVGGAYDIKAITPLICKFIDLADGLQTEGEWVSLVDIFGPRVPKEVSVILKKLVGQAIENGDISKKNRWQILEYLAADYLSGQKVLTKDQQSVKNEV